MPTYQLKNIPKIMWRSTKWAGKMFFFLLGSKHLARTNSIVDHFNVALRVEKVVLDYHYHLVFFRLFFANLNSRKNDNFLKCLNQKNEGKHAKNSKLIGCAKLNRPINPNRNRIRNRSKTGKVFDLYSNLDVLENYCWFHFDMVLFLT